jgi:hypothetical protein
MKEIAVEVNGSRVLAHEAREGDLDALVAYWHGSEPGYLESLGVDMGKLGTPEETYERLASRLKSGEDRRSLIVVAEMDGELVAYSNLRQIDPDTACGHLHTLVPTRWCARRSTSSSRRWSPPRGWSSGSRDCASRPPSPIAE